MVVMLAADDELRDEVAVVVDDDDVRDMDDENEDEAEDGVMLAMDWRTEMLTNGLNWIGLHNDRMNSLHSCECRKPVRRNHNIE